MKRVGEYHVAIIQEGTTGTFLALTPEDADRWPLRNPDHIRPGRAKTPELAAARFLWQEHCRKHRRFEGYFYGGCVTHKRKSEETGD